MNWKEIISNSKPIYVSSVEDKGFRNWSLKKISCDVLFYESYPLDNIDKIICSILDSYEGCLEEIKVATLLGFNVVDDFDAMPKRYADRAELDIFRAILKSVFEWGLIKRTIEIDNSEVIKITALGVRCLKTGLKHKFYIGKKDLLENFGLLSSDSKENTLFPFYSALGIDSIIENISQIPFDNIFIDEIFGIEDTELIHRHKLQSKNQYNIYKSDVTTFFKMGSCDIDVRLYNHGDEYYPIIFNNNQICYEATELLNKPENKNSKEKKVEWGLYLKLIKDPNATLDYKTIIPFEDLLEFDSLILDTRLAWDDEQLILFIAEKANANQWFKISNHCPICVLEQYLQFFKDKLDWTSLSQRIDDEFLVQNATIYPWNFEVISAKADINIELIKILLLIPELKEREWDWDAIMPLLDFEFIKTNINRIHFELSEITKNNVDDVRDLIAQYPDKRWNWTYISNEYDLNFILVNILKFKRFISVKIILNRAFVSTNELDSFCKSDDFKLVLLHEKNYSLKDYSPNQLSYIWTDSLIELLEITGFLTWESGRYASGFECNPYLVWDSDFFNKYNSRIATQKGLDFVSSQISDTNIVCEYPNFQWNWDIISRNTNLITNPNFILSVKDKLNFKILLTNISETTLDTIFDGANIFSYLETNQELWLDVTKKSSKEFILQHIDFDWDWSVLTRRFCSTIKVDALSNPKWIEKWDWSYLTQNLDLEVLTEKLDQYIERWDWEFLTRNLNKSFVLANLPEYNEYWYWNILLNERLEKQDLLINSHLVEVATCISLIGNERSEELWKTITAKYDYFELSELIKFTYNQSVFCWDYVHFYNLPNFNIRLYLIENYEYINWGALSGARSLNETFRWEKSLFSYEVWLNDVRKTLRNIDYHWDFIALSKINNLNWNDSILSINSEKWDWDYLSECSSCFKKNKEFLKHFHKFSNFIRFSIFSKRTDSEITENLLLDFIDRDWDWAALSANNTVKLSLSFIKDQKAKHWDWQALSFRIDIELDNATLIELSNQNWDWMALSSRQDILFSEDLILSLFEKPFDWQLVSKSNSFIPNSKTLSLLKGHPLDWAAISKNSNIAIDILWDYKDYLEWEYLTRNVKFDISNTELLIKYRDYLDWDYISQSDKFKTSFENLKQFKTNLNWHSVNNRIGLEVSKDLLEPFSDLLNWSNISQSMNIHFTEELIEQYRNKWDWQLLVQNPQVIERMDTTLKNYKAEINSVRFLEQFNTKPYIYHFTHLYNAVEIIKNRKILSRCKADGQFANAAGNLVSRRDTAHKYARFYFRPQTPTQFYNECLGWDNALTSSFGKSYYFQAKELGLPKCPIPVFFKFSLKEVLMKMIDKCFYSTGNMQTDRAKVLKVVENPTSLHTLFLYDNMSDAFSMAGGPYNYNRQLHLSILDKIKEYSQQEFLVYEEFNFSELDSFEIICYNDEYTNILKAQLGDDQLCEKINSNGWNIFHRNNRKLLLYETESEISITSEYQDKAYLSIRGEGLKNIEILNPNCVQKETLNEIFAYPGIKFVKTEQPIEVHFIDLEMGLRDWLIYKN